MQINTQVTMTPEEVESIIREMYENYGIDHLDMEEDEIARIFDHYYNNQDNLLNDFDSSKKKFDKIGDDILI